MRALMLAIGLMAAPAMAADQFDLVCTGRHKTSIAGSWKPYTSRYRVDTATKTYCRSECKSTESIESVDPSRIEFQEDNARESDGVTVIHYVDRSNGNWKYYFSAGPGVYENAEGTCEVAPFSGFPAAKF